MRAEETAGQSGGGTGGISYRIPLAVCEPKVQKKYINRQRKLNPPPPEPKSKLQAVTLEEMSQEERQEVAKWKNILDEWKEYREMGGPKKERDEEFVDYISKKYPEFHFSVRILQRQAQALREKGEAALIDRRGKHKNHHRAIPPEVFDAVLLDGLIQLVGSVRIRNLQRCEPVKCADPAACQRAVGIDIFRHFI